MTWAAESDSNCNLEATHRIYSTEFTEIPLEPNCFPVHPIGRGKPQKNGSEVTKLIEL
jgi:hypothetical protein